MRLGGDKRFVKVGHNEYVDTINADGEILDYTKVLEVLNLESQIKKKSRNLLSDEIDLVKKENGIQERKDTHYFDWNNKGHSVLFVKQYKTYNREVKQLMDKNEIVFYTIIIDYLEQESNRVVVNGERANNKVLSKLTGFSPATITRIIASLKEKNIIQTTGYGKGREIYLNPLLAFDGKDIKKETVKLFNIKI